MQKDEGESFNIYFYLENLLARLAENVRELQNASVMRANAAAGKARDHMAKEVVNKSAAIRDALKKFPRKTPLEISGYLKAEQGLDVPAQYISTVKFNMKAKKSARKLTKKVEANGSGDAEALYAAAQLVVKAGGVEQARAALAAVAKVASIIE